MLYECDYFKVVSCVCFNDTPKKQQIGLFGDYKVFLELAGHSRIEAEGPSRIEALFSAFGKAFSKELRIRAVGQSLPKPLQEYGDEIRAVADRFRDAAVVQNSNLVKLPPRGAAPEPERQLIASRM